AGTLRENRGFVAGGAGVLVVYRPHAPTLGLGGAVVPPPGSSAGAPGRFRAAGPHNKGIVEAARHRAGIGVPGKPERQKSDLAWAGLLVGTPALLEAIPEQTPCDLGRDVLPRLLGRSRGLEIDGYHRDVGTPESYRQACADLAAIESAA